MSAEILLVLSPAHESVGISLLPLIEVNGWSVLRAGSLAESCELLTERSFDVILLDLFLPDEQGIECFVRIFAEVPQTPIIILTAPADEELARQAVSAGAGVSVLSSSSPDELFAVIASAAGRGVSQSAGTRRVRDREEFASLAERFIHLARLSGKSLLLCAARSGGGAALQAPSGEVLLRSLRASDLLADLGEGRFAALAIVNPGDDSPRLLEDRLEESRASWNALHPETRVEMAATFQRLDPEEIVTAEELVLFAEASLSQLR